MVIKDSFLFIFDNMLTKTSVTGHPYGKEKSLFFFKFCITTVSQVVSNFSLCYSVYFRTFGVWPDLLERSQDSSTLTL